MFYITLHYKKERLTLAGSGRGKVDVLKINDDDDDDDSWTTYEFCDLVADHH